MVVISPSTEISNRAKTLIDNYTEAVAQFTMKYAHPKSKRELINNEYHISRNKLEQFISNLEKK